MESNIELRILFIEDLETDYILAEREIKKADVEFTSVRVETEKDFVHQLENFDPNFIISDYSMPEFDGMSALKIALEINPDIPFIILTGSMNEETAVECLKAGADDYVIKEHIKRLGPAILSVLDKRKIRQEREQTEALNRERAARYKFQRNLIAKLSFEDAIGNKPIDEALKILITQFAANLKVERTSVWLLSEEDKLLKRRMFFDSVSGIDSQVEVLNTAEFPSYFKALYKDSQIDASDAQNDPRTKELNESYFIPLQISSMLDSAIQREGRVIGVLSAEHRGPVRKWHPDEKSFSSSLTNLVSQLFAHAERKLAEEKMNNEANRRRILMEQSKDGIVVLDLDGKVFESNKSFADMLGYPLESMCQLNVLDWEFQYPPEQVLEMIRSVDENGDHFTSKHRRKDGSVYDVEISTNAAWFDGQKLVFCVCRDITERKEAETELRNLSVAVTQSPVSIIITNAEGIIEYANPKFLELTGYGYDEVIGQKPSLLKSGEQPESYYKKLWTTISSGKTWTGEFHNKKKNGESYWEYASISPIRDDSGNITQYVALKEDITERKLVEERIREKDAEFRKLSSNLPDLIFQFTRRPDGSYCVPIASEGIKNIFGCSPEDVVDDFAPIAKVIYPEDAERVINDIEYSAKHLTYFTCEFRVQIPGKPIQWIYSRSSPEKLADGSITWYGFNADITERKLAEAKEQELEAQLRQSQKLEAVGTMAGGIAHDFNNILQGLYLYSSIVEKQLPDDKELRANFKNIIDSSIRAKELVRQILTFSRKEEAILKPVRIQYLIKDALKLTRASTPSTIEIREKIDSNCGAVMCDATQIHQVFINLCNNAIHAMREKGGELSVSLQQTDSPIELEPGHAVTPKNGVLELMVSDTGHGMDATTLEKIFNPFFTTKGVNEGTGLGLSIVHGIIKDIQGQITVESQPGKGSTFRILLPICVDEEDSEEIQQGELGSVEGIRVLFVDDDKMISSAGKLILEARGYQVVTAASGLEGLKIFQKDIKAFDLIITDLTMPGMTGLELGKEVRKLSKDVLIVLTSGNLDPVLQSEFESLGFNGFVRKPWTAPEMLKVISSLDLG